MVETKIVTVTEEVPFVRTSREDATLAAGTTAVVVAGVAGVRTITYRVTLTDGIETGREQVESLVTTPPVDEVTAVGTYVAPPPVEEKDEPPGCDPNYAGACVPIDSDVDCAGGSGNGPSYVEGPVQVIGSDIYGLDNDGDGVGCES